MPTTTEAARQVIAGNVRALMGRHRTSQTRLAELLDMSQPAVSRRLGGKVAFDTDKLLAIAEHFGVPITDLFEGVAESANPSDAENPLLSVLV